jgi:ABC-2 type transport system permease protein
MAYLTLTMVGLVTALIFFDHLRIYNQILFLYSSTSMGGFDAHTIPDYVNLRYQVFLPVMETLGLTFIGLIPLVTMRVFAEERARQTDELLMTTLLSPNQIVLGLALASIGLACSAMTASQLVAAVSAYAIAFVFYDFSWATTFAGDAFGPFLDALSLHPRFGRFAEGLVRLADLAYFAGFVAVAFALARLSLAQVRVR